MIFIFIEKEVNSLPFLHSNKLEAEGEK